LYRGIIVIASSQRRNYMFDTTSYSLVNVLQQGIFHWIVVGFCVVEVIWLGRYCDRPAEPEAQALDLASSQAGR